MNKLNIEDIRQLLEYPKLRDTKINCNFIVKTRTLLILLQTIELAQWYKVCIVGTSDKATTKLNSELIVMVKKLNDKFSNAIDVGNIVKEDDCEILLKDYSFIYLEVSRS